MSRDTNVPNILQRFFFLNKLKIIFSIYNNVNDGAVPIKQLIVISNTRCYAPTNTTTPHMLLLHSIDLKYFQFQCIGWIDRFTIKSDDRKKKHLKLDCFFRI